MYNPHFLLLLLHRLSFFHPRQHKIECTILIFFCIAFTILLNSFFFYFFVISFLTLFLFCLDMFLWQYSILQQLKLQKEKSFF